MIKRKVVALVLVMAMTSILVAGCKTDTPIIGRFVGLENNEIFVVDELICTDSEYKLVLMNTQNTYKKDLGSISDWNVQVDDEYTLETFIKEKVKEDITVKYALSAMATNKGIVLSTNEQSKVIEAAATYYTSLSDAEKEYTGASQTDVENVFKNYLLADKVYRQLTEPIGTKITDEEARVIKIQYIRINSDNTKESTINRTLRDVTDLVNGGYQQFSREAKQYSEDDVIEKTIKKNEATAKFEVEAFNLATGEISNIIQDGNNYYLIYCVESYMEDDTIKNKNSIIEKEKQAYFNKQYTEYLVEAKTDFNTKAWNKIELTTDENVINATLISEFEKITKEE